MPAPSARVWRRRSAPHCPEERGGGPPAAPRPMRRWQGGRGDRRTARMACAVCHCRCATASSAAGHASLCSRTHTINMGVPVTYIEWNLPSHVSRINKSLQPPVNHTRRSYGCSTVDRLAQPRDHRVLLCPCLDKPGQVQQQRKCALSLHFQGLVLLVTPSDHGKRYWEACNTHTPSPSGFGVVTSHCLAAPPTLASKKSDRSVAVRPGFEPMIRGVCVRCLSRMLRCRP